jgi:hypothetical protein
MQHRTHTRRHGSTASHLHTSLIAAMLAFAGLASTASAEPPPPPDRKHAHPLGGPGVDDVNLPGKGRQFAQGMDADRKPAGRTNSRAIMQTLGSLGDPETPDDLRLTDDQREQIRAIADEFRDQMREFREQHKDEFEKLRGAGRPDRGPREGRGQRRGPDRDDRAPRDRDDNDMRAGPRNAGPQNADAQRDDNAPPPPRQRGERPGPGPRGERDEASPDQKAARQQMRDLMSKGPKIEDFQARLWDVLTPAQRELANQRLEAFRDQAPPREGQRRRDRQGRPDMQRDDNNQPGPRDGAPGNARGPRAGDDDRAGGPERGERRRQSMQDPERRERMIERLRERMETMPPEERERAQRRLDRMLNEGDDAPPPRDRPRRGRGPEDRPPPPRDDDRAPDRDGDDA